MATIAKELRGRGVEDKDIVYLDLDKRGNRSIKTPEQLEEKIESLLVDDDFDGFYISIRDAFPKVLIARTRHEPYTWEGVLVLDLARCLLGEQWF